jgi:hypothetical protein
LKKKRQTVAKCNFFETIEHKLGINAQILSGISIRNGDSWMNGRLDVKGKVRSEEVTVEIVDAPDYVFEPGYESQTLEEIKDYITKNKHLPEIPSAKEMETYGINLGDMNMRLLKKIEELTFAQIDLMEKLKKTERADTGT